MSIALNVLIIDISKKGVAKRWAQELQQRSSHNIQLVTGVDSTSTPDLVIATNTDDVIAANAAYPNIVVALYVHDALNPAAAKAAQYIFFASQYQHDYFVAQQPEIVAKSSVLPMAIDLQRLTAKKPTKIEKPMRAVVLWNHAWNKDSNPEQFFNALIEIAEERGLDFKLVVLGKPGESYPPIFDIAKERLADKILHWGYAETEAEYTQWLWLADILPVTATQDFTGISTIDAMYCNVVPYMPKRLVYPELIPEAYRNTFFYDEEDFVNKLQRRIWDVKYLRVMDTQQYAAKYDWSAQINNYDSAFERLVKQ